MRNRRRLIIGGVVLVVVLGGAGAAWAATRPSGPNYRTATAVAGTVTSTLDLTGTIEPVSEATVSFPVTGQVASVAVTQGQQVTAGQTLAQLNTTSMASELDSAQSSVATAQAKLASDQTSQTSTVGGSGSSNSGSGSSATLDPPASSGIDASLLASLNNGQAAVRKAQSTVDADIELAKAAVRQEDSACGPVIQSLGATATATTGSSAESSSAAPSTSPSSSSTASSAAASGSSGPSAADAANCANLLQQALDTESHTSTDEQALESAEAALTTSLNKASAEVQQAAKSSSAASSSSSSSSRSGSGSASNGSNNSSNGSSTGSHGSGPASAAQIAADQAQVDAANAQLGSVRQDQAAATLVSPIAGTVAQVNLAAGQSVSAGSSSATIVVIGPGTSEVTTAVTDIQVGQVKPGDPASVTPDGASKPITGTVTAIGALGSTTSSGSASFPVTISLSPTSTPLFTGANAAVSITLGSTKAAVTVPTSAVHTVSSVSIVEVLKNDKATAVPVKLGISGATVTQVTSGLSVGDQVVLANLSEALPTSGSTNARSVVGGALGGGAGSTAGGGLRNGTGGARSGG